MEIAYLFAGVIIGACIMAVIAKLIRPKPVGYLRVDHSDPEDPYLFLELGTSLPSLMKKKEVVLAIKVKDFISHK